MTKQTNVDTNFTHDISIPQTNNEYTKIGNHTQYGSSYPNRLYPEMAQHTRKQPGIPENSPFYSEMAYHTWK